MSDKSPRQSMSKSSGKSLKQKRADKKPASGEPTPIVPPSSKRKR